MWFETYFILSESLIFLGQFYSVISMVGENVKPAEKGEYPSVVSIAFLDNSNQRVENDHLCTGALVTRQHVLTAQHCLEDRLLSETVIIVGSRNLRRGRKMLPKWWIAYNEWIDFKDMALQYRMNDVAVIMLVESVPSNIGSAVLSTLTNAHLIGLQVTVAAWGETSPGVTPRRLQKVALTVLTKDECERRIVALHGSPLPVPDRYLCTAAEPYALMQNGDSGGPIFFQDEIVGVHKSTCPIGNRPYDPKLVNVHTGIDYYRHFILDVISQNFVWHDTTL